MNAFMFALLLPAPVDERMAYLVCEGFSPKRAVEMVLAEVLGIDSGPEEKA